MRWLDDAIGYFTDEKKILSCLSVTCGTKDEEIHALRGVANEQGGPMNERSLYDLASLTKLFTGLVIMRLQEEGLLDLAQPVTAYAPKFPNLQEVTVDQLLGFEVGLMTPQRVDTQPDRESGLQQLLAIRPVPVTGRAYSDMHSMVLKYVAEGAAQQPFFHLIKEKILQPLGMEDTFAHVPDSRLADCISYDGEHRIEKDRWILRRVAPGTPHDPKANLLQVGDDLCGHAGLFSTRGDMTKLCQGVLKEKIVTRESLRRMACNRTGKQNPDGTWTQYLGSQCYVKHPCQYFSEIPLYMSDEAIGLSGFTGHHLSIDPVTGRFTLFLGNRVMNRLSVLVPPAGKTRADYGLAPDGSGQIRWTDGTLLFSSVDYVHQKDARLHAPLASYLQLPVWTGWESGSRTAR